MFGGWGVVVVFWLLRSMPTPGPGDTATGTLPMSTEGCIPGPLRLDRDINHPLF
ncbi:hypothetical protein [Companilactobacillus furfuricola]|uniref:hypothetical protein n=1 Tax=Companilactobacillus furfuricola TaxID=1462575 RepID=UPI0013DDEE23|nr:hypothetical protein [Companilactobacillus furfuricola]